MLRVEYFPQIYSNAFSSPSLQFLYIPNDPFIHSTPHFGQYSGNDVGGIYAANYPDSVGDPLEIAQYGYPLQRFGRIYYDIDEGDPASEFALKFSAQVYGSLFSIMGFYGWDNYPVLSADYTKPGLDAGYYGLHENSLLETDIDGNALIYPLYHGYYAKEKFIGASWSTEFDTLKCSALGGAAPLFRVETRYDIDKTLANENWAYGFGKEYEKTDVFTYGLSLEQKIRIRGLQKSYWYFSFEYTNARLLDYDSDYTHDYWLTDDNDTAETFAFYFETSYYNGKLLPSFWYTRDITNHADAYYPGCTYTWSDQWNYYAGFGIFSGEGSRDWYGVDNKDYFVFKINYTF
jgi:hypothetical protein